MANRQRNASRCTCIFLYTMITLQNVVSFSHDSGRPNFIFILTDDQDIELGSIDVMPNLDSNIINQGISFTNAFVATSICCPSRTEYITGRYYHNIGAPNGNCMHVDAYNGIFNKTSLFPLLHSNGYATGMFGKLTNNVTFWCGKNGDGMNNPNITGFDRLFAMCQYHNYYCQHWINKYPNGTITFLNYSDNQVSPLLYQTSQIGNETLKWLDSMKNDSFKMPFFAWIAPHAPHFAAYPPVWYQNKFVDAS